MRAEMSKTAVLAVCLAGLPACAGNKEAYPSLAMRPFESGPPAEAEAPAIPIRPAASPARLAELRGAAATAHSAFVAREDEAARLVRAASGQPFESKARSAAMIALADLEAQRGRTAGALAALDELAAAAAGALSPDPALVAAQGEVAATLASEDRTITQLWNALER
jgi:hypothetical protein